MKEIIEEYAAKVLAERGQRAATQARYMLARMSLGGTTGRDMDEARTRLRSSLSASSANRIITEALLELRALRHKQTVVVEVDRLFDDLMWAQAKREAAR